ncbi:PEP-CTERM sorting domain-containing protein [Nitrosomonas sp. Is79A3]|uniref:PEP-CTERM sorting domain-containing protein n=1 Tax=Nitrosomonas sp. (strain Is79A3) TaxID=261292 RepID=UPI0012EAFD93
MKKLIGLVTLFTLAMPLQSMAAAVSVDAKLNSTSGGSGASVSVFSGNSFSVTVGPLDLWSAGAFPRWSNANGIDGPDLLATGLPDTNGDNPGVSAGTIIGSDIFGNWTQGGLNAPFGSLVGSFDNGVSFFNIGTNYVGIAASNILNLYYFDSNNGDNIGSIIANVSAVPEPETYVMLLAGLGLLGFSASRRKQGT